MYGCLKMVRPDGFVVYLKALFSINLKVMNISMDSIGKDYLCPGGNSNVIPNGGFDLIFQRYYTPVLINYFRSRECMQTAVRSSIGLTRGLNGISIIIVTKGWKTCV